MKHLIAIWESVATDDQSELPVRTQEVAHYSTKATTANVEDIILSDRWNCVESSTTMLVQKSNLQDSLVYIGNREKMELPKT